MSRLFCVLASLVALPATAQVDPTLVGMWQLQWAGPEMLWQVRADGTYRLIGTGARPNEHWGRMQATNGTWSSQWERGGDKGTYSLSGNAWTVTGSLGPGVWQRVWPSQSGGATCPHIDIAVVEQLFGGPVKGRMTGVTCELNAGRVGVVDAVSIEKEVPRTDTMRLKRADCATGANRDPGVRCIAGLGDVAFVENDVLYIYRQNTRIRISLSTYPTNAAINDADEIALGRSVLSRP
jgi:hypothetical protein